MALTILTLVLGAGNASAVKLHPVAAPETIGPDGTSGSSFGSAERKVSLAFQQATKRLYGLEADRRSAEHPSKLYGFDASVPGSYTPLAGFNPLVGEPLGSGEVSVDSSTLASTGNVYTLDALYGSVGKAFGFSSSGSSLSGWPVEINFVPGQSTSSISSDIAVNPITGEVWVADTALGAGIHRFSPSGVALSGLKTDPPGQPVRISFDSNGDLYAFMSQYPSIEQAVYKFEAPGYENPTKLETTSNLVRITIDGTTHDRYMVFGDRIERYSPDGALLEEFAKGLSDPITGMTINEANGDVYVANREKIYLYPGLDFPLPTTGAASNPSDTGVTLTGTVRPDGPVLTDCHFEYVTEAAFEATGFGDLGSGGEAPCAPAAGSIPADSSTHPVSAAVSGLSLGTPYRFRLVAANVNGPNFGSSVRFQTGKPLVETTGSPVRSATTALLDGRVFAHGAFSTYHFEYGSEGPCDANPCAATAAHPAGSGDEFALVSQQIEGLAPGTTYHYRVVADNGHASGAAFGDGMTLTTRASDAPLSHGHFPGPVGSDRAWEQVSIPNSGGNPVTGAEGVSDDGNRAFFRIHGGTPISTTGTFLSPLFAERTPTGWRSENIHPLREQLVGNNWLMPNGRSDLGDQVALNLGKGNVAAWRLRPGQPATSVFEEKASEFSPPVLVSADASRVLGLLRGTHDPDHPVASGQFNLYDVSSGTPKLASLMPDGSVPACGVPYGNGANLPEMEVNSRSGWVTADGSHAVFPSGCGVAQLYLRDFGAEETKPISSPPVSGPSCAAMFIKSNPTAVFFWTKTRLGVADTDPAGCGGDSDGDVYRYDIASGALQCVTCVVPGLDADVEADINPWKQVAVADDGSRVYFSSPRTLLPGAGRGVYRVMVASGDLAYVGAGFSVGFSAANGEAITSDGSAIAFNSASPTLNAIGGQQNAGTQQYYVYDDDDRSLSCVSCPPDGSAPLDRVGKPLVSPTEEGTGPNMTALSADGETFAFATTTPLVGADQNTPGGGQSLEGGTDVYEWRDGRQMIITDGLTDWAKDSAPYVSAITPSGRDVFFVAATQYTPDALDGYKRLYDARIGGGIEFPPPPKPCPLEVCQGTPKGAPEEAAPGSGSFSGLGNAKPNAKAKKKKAHKKRRHHKRARQQRANHDRRASR